MLLARLDGAWLPTLWCSLSSYSPPLREEQGLGHPVAERNRTRRQPQRCPSWVGWTLHLHMGRALPASWHCEVSRGECPWLSSCRVSSPAPPGPRAWPGAHPLTPGYPSGPGLKSKRGQGSRRREPKGSLDKPVLLLANWDGIPTNTLSLPSRLLRIQR